MIRKLVAIPSTFTGEKRDKKLRIFLISLVARAIVNFKINELAIYYDPDPKFESHGLGRFLLKVFKYLNTPPYLRKIAFPIDKELKEIGAALPIKARYHQNSDRYVYIYVVKTLKEHLIVTDGKNIYKIKKNKPLGKNRILILDKKTKEIVYPWETKEYMGYFVYYYNKPIFSFINHLKKKNFFIIATSRYGQDIRKAEVNIKNKNIAIIFGSFARGLEDVISLDKFDLAVNTIPNQYLDTIRTDEAILYTLEAFRLKNII